MGNGDPEEPRIKGKSREKEMLIRYDGETVEGEPEVVVRDPRKVRAADGSGSVVPLGRKGGMNSRPYRTEFHEVKYEVRLSPHPFLFSQSSGFMYI